jgi:hypothetical protein
MMAHEEKGAEGVDESSKDAFQANRNELEGSNKERITCENPNTREE